MWVLQDSEKKESCKHAYKFSMLRNEVIKDELYSVGLTGTNGIVLFPDYVSCPFYVFTTALRGKPAEVLKFEERGSLRVRKFSHF